ncbi:MAG: 2,3-bisphosphoglycerate-independent phosphoglycerate mutase, partial [Thermoplasmata archaeon]
DGLDLSRYRLGVTADHATPSILKGHSDYPVPFLLVGAGVTPDPGISGAKFCEATAARGALGRRRGPDVISLLLHPELLAST